MSVPNEPMSATNPQGDILYLLGGMNAKLDGVAAEQTAQRVEAVEFRAEVRSEIGVLRQDIGNVVTRVEVVESKQTPRVPWYSIAGGLGSLVAIGIGTVTLLKVINP